MVVLHVAAIVLKVRLQRPLATEVTLYGHSCQQSCEALKGHHPLSGVEGCVLDQRRLNPVLVPVLTCWVLCIVPRISNGCGVAVLHMLRVRIAGKLAWHGSMPRCIDALVRDVHRHDVQPERRQIFLQPEVIDDATGDQPIVPVSLGLVQVVLLEAHRAKGGKDCIRDCRASRHHGLLHMLGVHTAILIRLQDTFLVEPCQKRAWDPFRVLLPFGLRHWLATPLAIRLRRQGAGGQHRQKTHHSCHEAMRLCLGVAMEALNSA
mmetsp:Transcript_110154/g.262534  ORF Transcript_110154/g.262534 Transcript_110154/m.262534 type:complete len:263 (+) Transcript_110154:515-1303(+)